MQGPGKHILFYSIIAMMVSLFLSRGILSATMIFFIAACFFHTGLKTRWRHFIATPLLWGICLLFLLPFLSGLWSEDKQEWINGLRIKLPLLLLPPAFASPFSFSKKQWEWLAVVFILLITAATLWSMFQYMADMAAVHEGYLQARTMITPLENDHVRFSWLVCVTILLAGWLGWQKRGQGNVMWLPVLAAGWLIIFLHILAARTGLLAFYAAVFAVLLWFWGRKTKPFYKVIFLAIIIALPVVAWLALPTFRNKVKYFQYDYTFFKDAHYLPGGNDATRVISLKAGWNLMKENAVKGTGFGDIFTATKKWYGASYPQMLERDKILPSSEWLIYGTGCGIPGLLVFTAVMLLPFFTRVKYKGGWRLLNALVSVSFLFDIGLEVQFGVFIYAFVVLLAWKWFSEEA